MRTSINANVNVIRPGIRRNREAVVARGVDALRASGPGYRMQFHAMRPDHLGLDRPRGGILRLLDSRSSLSASSAWRSKAKASAASCFTSTTCTAALQPQQGPGRRERQAAVVAALPVARLLASA
jgi:hypothetical protein